MPRHADQIEFSKKGGAVLRQAKELGLLTDASVAAANTVEGLKTAVTTAGTAASVHAEIEPMLDKINKSIDSLAAIGDLTDALIAPLTTVDGLIALTASDNASNRASSVFE